MAHTPFSGDIPDDRLYCPQYDMWVRQDESGQFFVGASAFGIFLAGEIIAFTAKPNGATVEAGRGMGTVECRKTVLAVHAPIAMTLLEGNEHAEERPALINREPYGAGWMARIAPTDWSADKTRLIDGPAYRQHILRIEPEARFG